MTRKRAGWLVVLFLGEMLTATAMGFFEQEIARAVVLALLVKVAWWGDRRAVLRES
jgi:magnesium transporter